MFIQKYQKRRDLIYENQKRYCNNYFTNDVTLLQFSFVSANTTHVLWMLH